jgi:hypothetical protein
MRSRAIAVGVALALAVGCRTSGSPSRVAGGAPAGPAAEPRCGSAAACERRASARLEAVRGDPAALAQLLQRFPKGGDLHNHLSGAVYAESYLSWAREDGFRVNRDLTLVDPASCGTQCTELPDSPDDPRFDAIVRAWSMKDFQSGAETGHDHFFSAFARFSLVSHEARREAAMLAEAIRRAGDDTAIYLEVLVTVTRSPIKEIAQSAGALDPSDLAGFERTLHADPRWASLIASAREHLVELDQRARAVLRCGASDAAPACGVTVRYLAQVGRNAAPGLIFAELLAAFELGMTEPRLVGVDLVSPEDHPIALSNYDLHMALVGALSDQFRDRSAMRVTLHAGELSPALASPDDRSFHIRHAIEIGHAARIGHGVDVLSERDAPGLLAEMRERGVAVEICLTSNASILGIAGAAHPLSAYLAAGVPVLLATDDAGVSRSSLTGELVRAVAVQGLGYAQLKAMARTSVTAAFVAGPSLWSANGPPQRVPDCAGPATAAPSAACTAFLATSERARLQWALETQFAAFEAE